MRINNLNLFVLSDLHCNSQHQLNVIEESIDELKTLKIDLLLILGDLTENEKYLSALFKLFSGIRTEYGKFLVRGNHDYEGVSRQQK